MASLVNIMNVANPLNKAEWIIDKRWLDCLKCNFNLFFEWHVLNCRIKTGHSNLVSCFGPRMRALAKVFHRGENRGKIPCQRPNPRAKTWHKIWMTGLNPVDDPHSFPSKLTKQVPKILVYLRSPVPFDSAVTVSARPPNFECTHLLLRSANWWRRNILFSIAWTVWIHTECKLSTDNYVNY